MKIIALSVLLPIFASGMDFYNFEDLSGNNFIFNSFLDETKETLKQMGNTYSCEPQDDKASLDKKFISNDYWQKVALLPDQQSKNKALKEILKLNFTDYGYPLWRYHIAAAFSVAGVQPIDQKDSAQCLGNATLFQDYELCKLLLEHGINPNCAHNCHPVLFQVKNQKLAELLITYGAEPRVKKQDGDNLLKYAMYSWKKAELVSFYRSHRISPLETDEYNGTALHDLAFTNQDHSKKEIINKVSALLKDLSHEEITQLIYAQHKNQGSVFDILKTNICRENSEFLQKYLESYLEVGQLDRAELKLDEPKTQA